MSVWDHFSYFCVFIAVRYRLNKVEVEVRYDHSHAGFRSILDWFVALGSHLDDLKAYHAQGQAPPEIVASIERAKELVCRGASLARERLGVPPP